MPSKWTHCDGITLLLLGHWQSLGLRFWGGKVWATPWRYPGASSCYPVSQKTIRTSQVDRVCPSLQLQSAGCQLAVLDSLCRLRTAYADSRSGHPGSVVQGCVVRHSACISRRAIQDAFRVEGACRELSNFVTPSAPHLGVLYECHQQWSPWGDCFLAPGRLGVSHPGAYAISLSFWVKCGAKKLLWSPYESWWLRRDYYPIQRRQTWHLPPWLCTGCCCMLCQPSGCLSGVLKLCENRLGVISSERLLDYVQVGWWTGSSIVSRWGHVA